MAAGRTNIRRGERAATDRVVCLAKALDSRGSLTIKRQNADPKKPKGGINPAYTERVTIKDSDPGLPLLMKRVFGGRVFIERQRRRHAPPRYVYDVTERQAIKIVIAVRPYLREKGEQADLLLELRRWKEDPKARRITWWWANQHPGWRRMPMMTREEVARALRYASVRSVSRALQRGILVAVPVVVNGGWVDRRFPKPLVQALARLKRQRGDGALIANPPPLLAKYEGLYRAVSSLNSEARRRVAM